MGRRVVDMVGHVAGRLRVVAFAGLTVHRGRSRGALWRCLCDPELGGCGREVDVRGENLRDAQGTRSCGCLRREKARRAWARRHAAAPARVAAVAVAPAPRAARGTRMVALLATLLGALPDGLWLVDLAHACGVSPTRAAAALAACEREGIRLKRVTDDDGEVYITLLTGRPQPTAVAVSA